MKKERRGSNETHQQPETIDHVLLVQLRFWLFYPPVLVNDEVFSSAMRTARQHTSHGKTKRRKKAANEQFASICAISSAPSSQLEDTLERIKQTRNAKRTHLILPLPPHINRAHIPRRRMPLAYQLMPAVRNSLRRSRRSTMRRKGSVVGVVGPVCV
jgi:hypothetical protein